MTCPRSARYRRQSQGLSPDSKSTAWLPPIEIIAMKRSYKEFSKVI